MITYANPNDEKELHSLWKQCYNEDSNEYINLFMKSRFVQSKTVVNLINGRIIGAMYLLPCKTSSGEQVCYWYAGGVLPQYRGYGAFSDIVDFILEEMKAKGKKSICFAKPEMRTFYKSKGLSFEYSSAVKRYIADNKSKYTVLAKPINSSEYYKLRSNYIKSLNGIEWDEEAIKYAIIEKMFCGGFCDELIIEGKKYILNGKLEHNLLYVEEHSFTDSELEKYAPSISSYYKANEAVFISPVTAASVETVYSGSGNINQQNFWISLNLL